MKPYIKDIQHRFLNDNDVIKVIYEAAEKVGVIPNALELSTNPSLDPSILNILQAINSKHSVAPVTPQGVDPLEFVRSRYDQFDGDLQEYVEYVANEINSVVNSSSNE